MRGEGERSDGGVVFFAGTNTHYTRNVKDEDFAVADFTGLRGTDTVSYTHLTLPTTPYV